MQCTEVRTFWRECSGHSKIPNLFRGNAALLWIVLWMVLCSAGCATSTASDGLLRSLREAKDGLSQESTSTSKPLKVLPESLGSGALQSYILYALRHHPGLKARYAYWRAAVLQASVADQLPEPVFGYGVFLQHVETRVGPQRHRFSLAQSFPWPSRLRAAVEEASAAARVEEQRFEAQALQVQSGVADVWWQLWRVRRERHIQRDQYELLTQTLASVRARLEVGRASTADLAQLEVRQARQSDTLKALDESEMVFSAKLRQVIGVSGSFQVPTTLDTFVVPRLLDTEEALIAQSRQHPMLLVWTERAAQSRAQAEKARAQRFPNVKVGLQYIETGENPALRSDENGKDPILAHVEFPLPIWGSDYDSAAAAAKAREEAFSHEVTLAQQRAASEVQQLLAHLRNAQRRLQLYRTTLLPQAEFAHEAMLGAYEVGDTSVTALLQSFRELLELRLEEVAIQTRFARMWARLEAVVGRPLTTEVAP